MPTRSDSTTKGRRLRPSPKLPGDVVTKRDGGMVIESARDYDWHALTTVDVAGELYAVTRQAGSGARSHRYWLTPVTPQHVVRTVTKYTIAEPARSRRTAGPSRG